MESTPCNLDRTILFLRRHFHNAEEDIIRYLLRRLFRYRERPHTTHRIHHHRHRRPDHDQARHDHETNEEDYQAMIAFILEDEEDVVTVHP